MISAVTEYGRLGLTAVGDTPEEAWELHERATRGLIDYARRSCGLLEQNSPSDNATVAMPWL